MRPYATGHAASLDDFCILDKANNNFDLGYVHIAIFCKRLNARAEIRHTNPLQCSDCKIFACGKNLPHAKQLVG